MKTLDQNYEEPAMNLACDEILLNEVDSNRVHRHSSTDIDVEIAGVRSTHVVTRSGNEIFVQMERGTAHLSLVPRFIPPGSNEVADGLVSPMPGVVLLSLIHI